jgi:non-canonical (house-cleaning) NTP pyrophosphatase
MAQLQKKIGGGDDKPQKAKNKIGDDEKAKSAVERAKEAVKKADAAQERKGGHYVICCGIRTWVPD